MHGILENLENREMNKEENSHLQSNHLPVAQS